jgi:hypothetical protein
MTENKSAPERFIVLPSGVENVIQTPSFLTGKFAEAVFADYQRMVAESFSNNPHFQLQLRNGEIVQSTLQDVALLDEVLREKYGARVLLPSDLHEDMRVPTMIKDNHYVDRLALLLRGPEAKLYDARAKNIAETLETRKEIDVTRLREEPALVTGLKVIPASEGYGFIFVPAGERLNVVYSNKFLQEYNGGKFNGFDENGVPTDFAEEGIFTNYTNDARVARFNLGRGWDSNSDWDRFGDSDAVGRVVVADAVGAPKFSDVLKTQQKSELLGRLSETRKHLADLEVQLQ